MVRRAKREEVRALFIKIMLGIIASCLVLLTIQSLKPQPVTAGREEIVRVDIIKIGGYYVSKSEILNIGKERR